MTFNRQEWFREWYHKNHKRLLEQARERRLKNKNKKPKTKEEKTNKEKINARRRELRAKKKLEIEDKLYSK